MSGINTVLGNLDKWAKSKKIALEALGRVSGANMQAHARTNAPWTNRTGMARRGLRGGFVWEGSEGLCYIAHSMSYGIWLELANDGKYGILKNTRDKFAKVVLSQAERIMNK